MTLRVRYTRNTSYILPDQQDICNADMNELVAIRKSAHLKEKYGGK